MSRTVASLWDLQAQAQGDRRSFNSDSMGKYAILNALGFVLEE